MTVLIWGLIIAGGLFALVLTKGEKQSDESLREEEARARDGLDAELYRELTELLSRKKKIEAIKRLREKTGVGLYVAKQVVDTL